MQVEQGNLGGDEKSLTPIVFINGRFFGYKMTIGYFQKKKLLDGQCNTTEFSTNNSILNAILINL